MTVYMNYGSPSTQFHYDLRENVGFKKDAYNYFNTLTVQQVNTLDNVSLLDIYLSRGNAIEPHYHQNAAELVYGISGSAIVTLINPFTNQVLDYVLQPGQVVNIPQGWWHYEVATIDNTHLLAIFNTPTIETIFGSDILRLTPPHILSSIYCLDEAKIGAALSPIKETTVIGPPTQCTTKKRALRPQRPPSYGWPHHGYFSTAPRY